VQIAEREDKVQELQRTADALHADNEERAQSISAREAATFELQQQLGEQQAQLQQQADEVQTAMQALQVPVAYPSARIAALSNRDLKDTQSNM
jgi:chromosome segregation ATPase